MEPRNAKTTAKKSRSPYGSISYKTIDQYHNSFPPNIRQLLTELRQAIKEQAPEATEIISYNIPTFRLNRNLVHYAAYKHHIGFYPSTSPLVFFKEDLLTYKTSKGGIQFPIDKPLPLDLIQKIVKYRVEEEINIERYGS